jgi:ribosomal protein L9
MELLLKQNIEHLGRLGDVVKVKSGYARNYLLPRGLAVAVTKTTSPRSSARAPRPWPRSRSASRR